MKVKVIIFLFAIVSLFAFVLPSNDSTVVDKEKVTPKEKVNAEKEPMKPFAMIDKNQFD